MLRGAMRVPPPLSRGGSRQRRWGSGKPYLVVGEGIVAPLMAICLREAGLHAVLVCRDAPQQSIENSSVVLAPAITSYLTEDLGLAGARPVGSAVTSYYTYDQAGNVLMNLNLDSLRPADGGTFFSSQRKVIQSLLLRECQKGAAFLKEKNPVRVISRAEVTSLSQSHGGITANLSRGSLGNTAFAAVINVSRDMNAVPLLSSHETVVQRRQTLIREYERAVSRAPFFAEWRVPTPYWDLAADDIAEIVHRAGRKMFVRPVGASEAAITLNMPPRVRLEHAKPADHYKALREFWDRDGGVQHPLWLNSIVPALQEALLKAPKVNYFSPTYCFDNWSEDNHRILRLGPAAHGGTAQPVSVADAIDFKDCFLLAEHLAENGLDDIDHFLSTRRAEVLNEIGSMGFLDDFSFSHRSAFIFFIARSKTMWFRSHQRAWKRSLAPFC
eukprot:Sspe_Gene.30925::Locus_15280_Transcript_1_1_Confidence_1.000_Length_1420::g.30925::m.30925